MFSVGNVQVGEVVVRGWSGNPEAVSSYLDRVLDVRHEFCQESVKNAVYIWYTIGITLPAP
jgi:hypothetical protein